MRGGWDIDIRSLGILCDTGWDMINEVTDVTEEFDRYGCTDNTRLSDRVLQTKTAPIVKGTLH